MVRFAEQKLVLVEALLPLCPFVHVLGNQSGIEGLPKDLQRPDLVLRIGRNPKVLGMPDLVLDETGFSGTFSVQPSRHFVRVPWDAVTRCWIGEPFVGPLVVWPQLLDGPTPETQNKPERPGLRLV